GQSQFRIHLTPPPSLNSNVTPPQPVRVREAQTQRERHTHTTHARAGWIHHLCPLYRLPGTSCRLHHPHFRPPRPAPAAAPVTPFSSPRGSSTPSPRPVGSPEGSRAFRGSTSPPG